ncbi:hypothetical protein ABPG72_005521 [Tetrahymena utriculariae]
MSQVEEFQFLNGEKIIFCYDGKEEAVELKCLSESGLIREILIQHPPISPQNPLTVTLPKWVSQEVFSVFNDYIRKKNLNSWSDRTIQLTDQTLQRLLWMGDYFQIDDFQYKCITDVLIPRIRVNNCLLFLNEAFKKLKACEDSCDIWYMLLNTGMNFTAKNLIHIFKNNPQELNKINNKIMEEIIERSLKYFKKKQNFDYKDMVDVILYIRNVQDCFELLFVQRKNIINRRINYQNHPSISWKLSNISSIINKETNPFKFNEYQWKLVAKMEDDKITGKILRIYLKLESSIQSSSTNSQSGQNGSKSRQKAVEAESTGAAANNDNDPSKDPFKKIIAIYFLLKLNDKEYSTSFNIKHIIIERAPQILLCEFEGQQLKSFENKKLEFTVYLNTDYIYSLLLNYIAKSIESFTSNPNFNMMSEDDIVAIVKSLPFTPTHQERAFQIAQVIVSQQNNPITNPVELFKAIDYNSISLQSLNNFQSQKKFRITPELKKFMDGELNKKVNGGSSSKQQISSSSNINIDTTSLRDQSSAEIFQNPNPFEIQKRDTEGPADSDGFTFNRPENNFRQYMQRNDSQDIRKKTLSQDQFGIRRNISEDQNPNLYNFSQTPSGFGFGQERSGTQQDMPINKLDKLKKTPSTNNSIPESLGSPFPPSYTMGSDNKQMSQIQNSNFNSSQKMQLLGSPSVNVQNNKIGPFIQPSLQNQSQLSQQNSSMNFLKSPQQQSVQANSHGSPQMQQLIGSQNILGGSAFKQNPPQPPLRPSSSSQQTQDQNPLNFEKENRKKQLFNELDLKKYVLNQNLLNELQDISIF